MTQGQSNIVNGGFETPDLKSKDTKDTGWANESADNVDGWMTTATDNNIEFGWMTAKGTSPHMIPTTTKVLIGEGASDGVQFAEVVADQEGSLFQSLSLSAGHYYNWTVHHRGRAGVDTAALFITEDTHVSHVKSTATDTDHFYQILNWMKANGVTAPAAGNMVEYTVYTTEPLAGTAFQESSTGSYFSFDPDSEHTVKFEVWLMSTDRASWGEYNGKFRSETDQDILFLLAFFDATNTNSKKTSGNLIDNCSFLDSRGNNLLVNAGFDDVAIKSGSDKLKGANAPSPKAGIGWCTTATDYYVEIGNLKNANSYGLDISWQTVVSNTPSIREGNQFVELNAEQESSLYQIVSTEPGKMYKWSLSHRGRSGVDTMALIIGPEQPYKPLKETSSSRDQLMQIVDWLNSQTERVLDISEEGCSDRITLYTPKFNSSGGWTLSSNIFSWQKDAEHTEEWSVWVISSRNDTWYDYGELDNGATYDYGYVVPQGNSQSIFGFVSIASRREDGTKHVATYGNLLDNISFKEYYYVRIKNAINSGGGDLYISSDDGSFMYDSRTAGWALAGSDLSFHLKRGGQENIRTYLNDVFVPLDEWTYDEASGEYTYNLENISSAMQMEVVYASPETVVYDSRNDYPYEYQYDAETGSYSGGYAVRLGQVFPEYISHAPQYDDGWEFADWKYFFPVSSSDIDPVYRLEAEHKVVYESNDGVETFAIYRILSDGETELVVDNIPYDEGITFFAEWKYRQRVVSKTYSRDTSQYEISAKGGTSELTVVLGDASEKSDYTVDSVKVGEELYAFDSTYINVTAHKENGYSFNGWYDGSGNLVSNSISYTYRAGANEVVELYAYFEPVGYNISVQCSVEDSSDSERYFAIDCTFSWLRENKVYSITGLDIDPITIDGENVTNPNKIKADEMGNASVTIYMKHGQIAKFASLPLDYVYSVVSHDYRGDGYNVRGEASYVISNEEATVSLQYYHLSQSLMLEAGRHYAGVTSGRSPDIISITENSSYTLDVVTQYNPGIYTGLKTSLGFFDASGAEKAFAAGTRILMVDFTDESNPQYFQFVVPDSADPISMIQIEQFKELGTSQPYQQKEADSGKIRERLVFLIDYVGTSVIAESGSIALVYEDVDNDLINTLKPDKRGVEIGADATQLTVAAANNGSFANIGPFTLNTTVNSSTHTVNTAYEDGLYAIKLSVDGGVFPDGSYALVDGNRYYSNNGNIMVSPLRSGEFTVDIYSPLPIALTDGKATFNAGLLPAVSSSALSPTVNSTPVYLNCIDVAECAINADIFTRVFDPGYISAVDITLQHENIDRVLLTVNRKNRDGTYTEIVGNMIVNLPADNNVFTVNINNGFNAVSGETYVFSFVGYVDDFPVCRDVCYILIGY